MKFTNTKSFPVIVAGQAIEPGYTIDTDPDGIVVPGTVLADLVEPARNGSREAWAAYALAAGVAFPDDAGRDDIIAAVDAAPIELNDHNESEEGAS